MKKHSKKIIYGFLLLITLLWIIDGIINFELNSSNVIKVSGVLKTDPKFDRTKSGRYLELILNDNRFRYQVGGTIYDDLDVESVYSDLKKDSVVSFYIIKSKGINEFLDELVGVIDIYGLESKGKKILKLEDVNKRNKSERYYPIIIWIILFTIYLFRNWIKFPVHLFKSKKRNAL